MITSGTPRANPRTLCLTQLASFTDLEIGTTFNAWMATDGTSVTMYVSTAKDHLGSTLIGRRQRAVRQVTFGLISPRQNM